jgi:DNA excision repair protein ERCC-1
MDETGKLPSSEETETTFRPGDLVNREAISFSEDKKSDEESQEPSATVTSAQPKPINPRAIIINPAQKRNPIIKHIRNVPYEYGDIVADYVMGATTCALFLSLRYHCLHPNYIHERLQQLGNSYELRVLLVVVDVVSVSHTVMHCCIFMIGNQYQ